MRLCVLLLAALVVATAAVDPCKRQPFRGRCPSQNGETPKRSQFVLRYYLRNGECVSYPYGHCATDPSEPNLYRYKEECEDACISNAPANLGVPKSTTEDYQKEILSKEVKRVEFYATSTLNYGPPGSSRQTPPNVYTLPVTTTEAPVTTTYPYTYPRTSESTETPQTRSPQTKPTTTTEDPQPFEFHEETTGAHSTSEASEQVDEQPFNFNEHDLGTPITSTFTSTTPESETTSFTTQVTTTEASTSSEVTTEPSTTTTESTEAPTTTVEQTTTTTEEVTTTEEPSTTTEEVTTTTRMSTTSPSTTSTTTQTASTTTLRQQTTEASTTPSTTTTEAVSTTPVPRTECERRRASASSSSIQGGFVPVCTSSGDFERVQCETNGRQCFCVNTQGIEVPNSRTRDGSRPDCYSIQSSRQVNTKECVGASTPGPCHGSFQRFFYNEDSQKCEQFTYSGCGGNGNNYESREACEDRCAPPPVGLPKCEIGEPLKTKIGVPVNCAKTDCPSGYRCSVVQHSSVCCPENNKAVGLQTNGRASRCALPKERGPCDKYELRFYFNADLNECKYFFWGGCEGNQNNFERVEECETSCGVQKSGVTNRPNTEIRTTQGIRITPNGGKLTWEEEEEDVVQTTTPITPVPTTARQTPRAPVQTTPRPTAPTTTASTTRASRVQATRAPAPIVAEASEEEEEEEVVQEEDDEQKEQPLHIQPPVPQQNTVLLGVNRCLHPKDSGNCHGQFVRWFFDDEKKNCDVFTYTGCQGNGNNFASKEECMAICHKPEPTPSATPDFSQVCTNDVDAGECNGVFERFAFDSESQDCRAFVYGGCGGNGNNFATLNECRSRCVTAVKKPPVSTCEADIDVGECAGVFSRFAFDKSINACRSFTYGGCGGNANNFATLQECTSKCVNRAVCPEPPACDTTRCQLVNDRSGCPFCSCPPVKQASPPGSIISTPRESLPNCPPLDRSACHEPCMMFHNRQGCEECVCPQTAPIPPHVPTRQPTTQGAPQPPSSSRRVEVGPPSPRTTDAAPPAPTAAPRQFAVNTVEHQQVKPDQFNSLPRTIAAQIEEKCLQPVEPGPCKNFADRWYFNVDDGTCHPFKYGGCAGNRNHFFTQKECEVHCARFLSIHDDEDDESLEVEDEHRSRPRIHGVPIQPTIPLVVPTYSSPIPAVRGPTGKIEGLETIGSHQEPHPPAPSTMIVPRLPSARIQGFQVTRPSTTTTTTKAPTPSTIQSTEPSAESETSEEIQQTEDVQPLPVIKEVHEEQAGGKNVQVVDLEKVNAPKAQTPTEDFDRDMMLGSGEGSGTSSEFEMASEEEEEVTKQRPVASEEKEETKRTETSIPTTTKTILETTSTTVVPTTETTTTITTTTEEPSTSHTVVASSSEFKTTSEEETTSAEVVSTSEETTTTTPLKKIQIRPRVSSTTTTTTASPATTSSVQTTSAHSTPSQSSQPSRQSQSPSSPSSHSPREPEIITSSESGEVVSDFAFNSDEEHDENTEIVETSPDTARAAGSKTLSAVKAVETKHHKEVEQQSQEHNGINRKMESINIDLPEHTETLAPAPVTTTTQTTTTTTGTTPQPHFEPKFDGRIVCAMPPDAGVCTNFSPRWFFNSQTGQCEQFSYGSCGGNENNFFDRNTCERKCMPHHVILAQVPDRCSYDKDSGSGKGYNVKWYFNMKNLRCEQFVFEGLGGNTNQFETLSECERICTPSGPKTPTLPPQPVHEVPEIISTLPIGAPGSQRPTVNTPTTTFATTTQFDSQEIYDDDDDEEPIIVPEINNEMPPLSPANTFGNINDNVELRLPEVVQTVQPTFAPTQPSTTPTPITRAPTTQAPTTQAPTTTVRTTVAQAVPTAPIASVAPVAPVSRPVSTVPVPVLLPETQEIPDVVVPEQALPVAPVVPIVPVESISSTGPVGPQPATAQTSAPTASTPLPPSLEPRPPAAFAAKTVVQTPTYKADPVVGREHIPTANDGQPLVAPSPKETINYQTGQVNTPTPKQAGIKSFDGSQDAKLSVDLFNKAGPTTSVNGMPACANGRTEKRYSDGRPVMCLPGKNQCPDGSSCYFNGLDFFCCPEEEDPYDKHAFGGYGGEETKNGYKVFGALNIRRLMDEVPLRLKRQANINFNIDSVVAPLRFDAEKPRQVSRALRMKSSPAVPRHGANPLCIQPVVKGSCQEAHLRYYYDRVTDSCRLFEYSGCDGNANNFGSLEDCQRLCVLNVQNIKNGQLATTTAAPMITPEEEEKLAPGQCPGGRAPLGGSSPVLCGNSTESIGCPTSYYCRRGPPDVCCPGTDPKLMQPEEIVKDVGRGVVKNESHMPRGFNRQIFLSTPKYMCPDAADPLMLENGEPMLCGSGFDGVKMCPKGYYCAIDSARNSRLCCPLYGDAHRIAPEEVFAPRLASNTETTTVKLAEDVNVEEQEEEEEEEEGEDFVAHLKVKPDRPGNVLEDLVKDSTDLTEEGEVSIDLGSQDKVEEEEITTTTEKMMVQDKSVCQIKPAEGRPCNESETPTRTNLQYFYSPKHNRCKLFFFQGCGGNLNRFEKKSDCEALCL